MPYILTIDVAHPARLPAAVEAALQDALMQVRNSRQWRAVKVVHGYGSHDKGGATKETVRNWAYQFRRHFRALINGEDYSIFQDDTQEMRDECGQDADSDLEASNPGITILWVK
ncbi:MAG: hypothetical protein ACREOO_16650 [bacterium]